MNLVANWREAWKWFSVHAFALIIALPIIWATLPAEIKAYMPESWEPWVFVTIAIAGVIGRVIDQGSKAEA